jgi:hypothetical protein
MRYEVTSFACTDHRNKFIIYRELERNRKSCKAIAKNAEKEESKVYGGTVYGGTVR